MHARTIEQLRERLAALNPASLEIIDNSALHAGHAGAGQGGHFRVIIRSTAFAGKNTLARHRLIYDAAGDLMQDAIHALSIDAAPPAHA